MLVPVPVGVSERRLLRRHAIFFLADMRLGGSGVARVSTLNSKVHGKFCRIPVNDSGCCGVLLLAPIQVPLPAKCCARSSCVDFA